MKTIYDIEPIKLDKLPPKAREGWEQLTEMLAIGYRRKIAAERREEIS